MSVVSVFDFIPTGEQAAIVAGTSTTDVTSYIQAALDTGSDVYFPDGKYMVDATPANCLKPVSNQKLILGGGALLQAITNNLDTYYVIDVRDAEGVVIEGGTISGDRATHTGVTGEHGMGIAVYNSSNIVLRGLRAQDCWGDGIYVGGTGLSGQSANVTIESVSCDNNRRNGLSIVAVDGCLVRGGNFTGSNGVAGAECGIDVEPTPGKAPGANIILDGVTCRDNAGPGIACSQTILSNVKMLAPTCVGNGQDGIRCGYVGQDVQIVAPNCRGNAEHGIFVFGDPAYVTRNIHVTDPICSENGWCGIKIGLNVDVFSVIGGTVRQNGQHGIMLDATGSGTPICDNGVVKGVNVLENGTSSDETYDNIHVGANTRFHVVEGCVVQRGALANKPRYGINITVNKAHLVDGNMLYVAGETANANGVANASVTFRNNIGFKTESQALGTFACNTTGTRTVSVAHGLAYTPSPSHCTASVGDTSGYGFQTNAPLFRSADGTNVVYDVKVTTSGGASGDVGQLLVSITRPSAL